MPATRIDHQTCAKSWLLPRVVALEKCIRLSTCWLRSTGYRQPWFMLSNPRPTYTLVPTPLHRHPHFWEVHALCADVHTLPAATSTWTHTHTLTKIRNVARERWLREKRERTRESVRETERRIRYKVLASVSLTPRSRGRMYGWWKAKTNSRKNELCLHQIISKSGL